IEHVPAVDDLQTKRDLVLALKVALTVRVTEPDDLKRKIPLNTPPDTALEVTDDGLDANTVLNLRSARNSVTSNRAEAHQVPRGLKQRHIGEQAHTIRVPGSRDLETVRRVQRDTGRTHHLPGSRVQQSTERVLKIGLRVAGGLDTTPGSGQVVSPLRDLGSGQGVDAVVQPQVQGTRQRLTTSAGQLRQNTELVILISPQHFLVEAHGDLRLLRGSGHRIKRPGGVPLVCAHLHELSLRHIIERDVVDVAELHR